MGILTSPCTSLRKIFYYFLSSFFLLSVLAFFTPAQMLASSNYTVNGTVSDNTTGLPIAGANVWLYNPSTYDCYGAAPAGADGLYSLSVPSGSYIVGTTASGYGQYTGTVSVSENTTNNISLGAGYVIAGVVINSATGLPVPGASVWFYQSGQTGFGGPPTGSDGTYNITVAAGNYLVGAMASGYSQYSGSVNVSGNVTNNISLSAGYMISGVVTNNATGLPVSGANVWVYNHSTRQGFGTPPTGADGTYNITVTDGTYQLNARAAGYSQYSESIVISGNTTGNISLSSGYTVSGVVRNGGGSPISGANVWLSQPGQPGFGGPPTGADGTFNITVTAGSYQIGAMASGFTQYTGSISISGNTTNNITLSSGYTISGIVSDNVSGLPVSGVNVWVYNESTRQGYGGPQTGADGSYNITVTAGTYRINAMASGYSQYSGSVVVSGITTSNISLSSGYTVSGVIKDGGGSPISGANVWLGRIGQPGFGGPPTGADGTFNITVTAGSYQIGAMASGYAQYFSSISISGNTTNNITLTSGYTVSGIISDNVSGLPVSGANVWVYNESTRQGYGGPQTRADGSYNITVTAGTYRINAMATGYSQYSGSVVVSGITTSNISLSSGSVISGVIKDSGGSPISGANVWLGRMGQPGFGGPPTGADGVYSVTVSAGSYQIGAMATGYSQYFGSISVSGNTTLNITLSSGYTVSGVVTDGVSGLPISGVNVWMSSGTQGYGGPPTGADGVYSLTVTAGSYRINAMASGHSQYSGSVVVSGNTTANISLSSGSTVSGVVKDGGGSPISGANVWISQPGQPGFGGPPTGADGVYSVTVSAGSYQVGAMATGFSQYFGSISVSGNTTLNITLSSGYTVSGVVTDNASGLPISGAFVWMSSGTQGYGGPPTGADGVYSLTVTAGSYRINAMASGHSQYTGSVVVSGNATANISLSSGSLVSGVVKDGGGSPISGANVWISQPGQPGFGGPPTGADGVYSVTVSAGSYQVGAMASGYAQYFGSISVSGNTTLNITLSSGYTVSGVVTDNVSGLPISGANVWMSSGTQGYGGPPTGADGVYSLTVTSGTYRINAMASGYSQYSGSVVVSGNTTSNISLSSGYIVSGVVKDGGGSPISGANVWISQPGQPGFGGPPTGADGVYSVTVLAGSYQVGASAAGYAQYFGSVTVSGNTTLNITLTSGYTVSGVVTDNVSGLPIPNASVWLSTPGPGGQGYGGPPTSSNGSYSLTVPSGTYILNGSANGYIQYTGNITVSGNISRNISISSGYIVSGVVSVNGTGVPISGASVWLSVGQNQNYFGPPTDAGGYYSITVPNGTYTLGASSAGFVQYSKSVNVTGNRSEDILMTVGYTVSGVVTDNGTGSPVSSVSVWVWDQIRNVTYYAQNTAANGTYSITAPASNYTLNARRGNYQQYAEVLSVSSNVSNRNISMQPGGYQLRGTVTDIDTGAPISGAGVWLHDPLTNFDYPTQTSDNGSYLLTVASGNYTLGIRNRGYANYAANLTISGNTTRNVTLSSTFITISGNITDFGTGVPIAGASVILLNSSDIPYAALPSGFDGSYAIRIPTGIYRILVSATGYTSVSIGPGVLSSNGTQDVQLSP